MELSDKIIQNLVAISGACLRGEKVTVEPAAMAELWTDVAAGHAYLKRDKTPPGLIPCGPPAQENA
jgi:hypothetical protein